MRIFLLALLFLPLTLTGCTSTREITCIMFKGPDASCMDLGGQKTSLNAARDHQYPPSPPRMNAPDAIVAQAIRADRAGDKLRPLALFTAAAEKGDPKAMTTVALMHYNGEGTQKDFCAAYDWFQRAAKFPDADALNNLGVMFRNGECVRQNRKVAYLTFLYLHMERLGSASTQLRSNANLRREVAELSEAERSEALCYTLTYYKALLLSRGEATEIKPHMLPSHENLSFRDARWWSRAEREAMNFTCPEPWIRRG